MLEFFTASVGNRTSGRIAHLVRAVALSFLAMVPAACSTLPTSGPTASQIVAGERADSGPSYRIVDVSNQVELPPEQRGGLDWAVPPPIEDRLVVGPGDVLSIRLFEVGIRLFSGTGASSDAASDVGARSENLPEVRVDEQGDIALPYAGQIHVAGLAANEIEEQIARRFSRFSQDMRVMVTVAKDETNVVVVAGAVGKAGRYPLTQAHERILDIVAEAGGASVRASDVVVRLTRKGIVSSTRLRQLLNDAQKNVRLAPGDLVYLEPQPLTYSVFGAVGKVSQIPFDQDRITLAEAIARAGGPDDNRADPTGVFLFRYDPDAGDAQRTIYRLNLLKPSNYFLAQNFYLQDKDVLYFANARSNQPAKFVQILNQLFSPILTVRAVTQ